MEKIREIYHQNILLSGFGLKGHSHNKYNNIVDELAQGAIRR